MLWNIGFLRLALKVRPMIHPQVFIEKMRELYAHTSAMEEKVKEEFRPHPPGINSLCDRIGRSISENIDSIENAADIFQLIEEGISNGTDELRDAIATGLIEAMISESDGHPGKWDGMFPHLGPQCAVYAKAWITYTETGKMPEPGDAVNDSD